MVQVLACVPQVSLWVVVDLETREGRAVAKAAISHVKASNQVTSVLPFVQIIEIIGGIKNRNLVSPGLVY